MDEKLSNISIKIADFAPESVVDGSGIRFTIFVQGCPHRCEGCHNPSTHSFDGGQEYSLAQIVNLIKKNPLLDGITLSGGEPFVYAEQLVTLCKWAHKNNLNIWCYTGYTLEQILQSNNQHFLNLLNNIDVLIDGPFVLSQKDLTLKFKGSKNQRIINLKQMRSQNSSNPIIIG